jgi:UrcA family protein
VKLTPFICAALLASSLASAAAPSPLDSSRERVVSFADLDLTRAADAKKLYQRIRAAAREVCWMPGLGAVMASEFRRNCVKDATARALAQVDAPGLKECATCSLVARVDKVAE